MNDAAVARIPGIDYEFRQPELLARALTHKSRGSINYERLEFLGDSILSFVVAGYLFEAHPDDNEGDLSRLRSRVVRGETLAKLALELELGEHLRLGSGELKSGGFRRHSILSDALEAVLGAIYLDGGFEACRGVILDLFTPIIDQLPDAEALKDPKTRLQEWLQARSRPLPEYRLIRETGAEHAKQFLVACRLADSKKQVEATGKSRRKAEQAAAADMLARLRSGAGQ